MSMLGTVPVFPGWGSAETLDLKFSNNVFEDGEAMSSTLGTEQFSEDTNLGDSFVHDSHLQAHFSATWDDSILKHWGQPGHPVPSLGPFSGISGPQACAATLSSVARSSCLCISERGLLIYPE